MKILIICDSCSRKHGVTKSVLSIAQNLGKTEQVFIFSLFPLFGKNRSNLDSRVIVLKKKITLHFFLKIFKDFPKSCNVVRQYINPMSVRGLIYLIEILINSVFLEIFLDEYKPDVVHIHGILLENVTFFDMFLSRGIPFVATAHGFYSHDPTIKIYYNPKLEQDVINKLISNKIPITTVSYSAKEIAIKNFHLSSGTINVITNGIDLERFNPEKHLSREEIREKYGIPNNKFVFLQVGTLSKRKNHIAVLEAISKMPAYLKEKIYYTAVGGGEEKSVLLEFCRKNNIEHLCAFPGQLPDIDLEGLYLASDFFILPSTSEGLALVTLEAMAAGLPIISYGTLEGITDIFHPDYMQIIPSRETMDVVSSIKIAIERKWNRNKIKQYAENWTWDKPCQEYLALYKLTIRNSQRKIDKICTNYLTVILR
jgi:teichuronic acid biosynthesis glycosyltransferase TuaC